MLRVAFTLIAILSAACSFKFSTANFEKDKQNAVAATNQFHELYNREKFEEIYEMTDRRAKETKSKEGLISVLTYMKRVRGPVLQSEVVDAKVEPHALYREIDLTFRTKFANADVTETFIWYASNDGMGLFSFSSN